MKRNTFKQLFTGFFYGLLSRQEEQEFIHSDESRKMLWEQWENPQSLKHKVPVPNREAIYTGIIKQTAGNKPRTRVKRLEWFARAAVLAIIIGLSVANYLYWQQKANDTVAMVYQRTGKNQRMTFTLPDQSRVTLNSKSELGYPRKFRGDIRNVKLKGEGFFQVQDNHESPFVVKTADFQVEVTGTSFSVSNYPGKKHAETVLLEGGVKIRKPGNDEELHMKPNAMVRYSKRQQAFTKNKINAEQRTAWRKGVLIFDNAPISKVANQLENWYGIEIEVESKLKERNRYTMKIRGERLEEVIHLLKLTTPIEHTIKGDTVKLRYAGD